MIPSLRRWGKGMAKIYLAATYSRHPELQDYARQLQDMGHKIVSRWVWGEHAALDGDIMGTGNAEFAGQMASEDEDDVRSCDFLIHFTEPPETNARRGGAHVEFGMARALGKKLFLVGYHTNIFHHLPKKEVEVHMFGEGVEFDPEIETLYAPMFFPDWETAHTFFKSLSIMKGTTYADGD